MPMAPMNTQLAPTPMQPSPVPKTEPKKNGSGAAEEKKNGDEKKEEEAKEDDKGYFMKAIAGTPFGTMLEADGIKVDGWAAFSYTISSRNVSNLPVTWNDRADTALLQQFWVNIEKPVDWSLCEVQHGFKVALSTAAIIASP